MSAFAVDTIDAAWLTAWAVAPHENILKNIRCNRACVGNFEPPSSFCAGRCRWSWSPDKVMPPIGARPAQCIARRACERSRPCQLTRAVGIQLGEGVGLGWRRLSKSFGASQLGHFDFLCSYCHHVHLYFEVWQKKFEHNQLRHDRAAYSRELPNSSSPCRRSPLCNGLGLAPRREPRLHPGLRFPVIASCRKVKPSAL